MVSEIIMGVIWNYEKGHNPKMEMMKKKKVNENKKTQKPLR